mgnify:CR=1 FL=1
MLKISSRLLESRSIIVFHGKLLIDNRAPISFRLFKCIACPGRRLQEKLLAFIEWNGSVFHWADAAAALVNIIQLLRAQRWVMLTHISEMLLLVVVIIMVLRLMIFC